jgi:uncharacterized integral membrane protein (TIGR00698 family)
MEGLYDPIVATSTTVAPAAAKRHELLPGYAFAAGVALLAMLAHRLPFAPFTVAVEAGTRHPISGAILAILIGLTLRNLLSLPRGINAGCKHVIKKVIPIAIVLMGARLHLGHMVDLGLMALFVTVCCIGVAIGSSYYIGKMLGLNWKTSLLLGTGTGICGNSAIVAVAPLIDARDDDLVLSVGAVNLFGLLAMLAFPICGGLIGVTEDAFGIWAGTSIHAVPQVVAAGFAFGTDAGTLATAVKLFRVTMLAPLVFVLAIMYARHHAADKGDHKRITVRYARLVPWFVWGFVLFAVLNSFDLLPTLVFPTTNAFGADGLSQIELGGLMSTGAKILLTLAMAAIGLEVNLRTLGGVGVTAVKAGLLSTLTLSIVSLLLIMLLM